MISAKAAGRPWLAHYEPGVPHEPTFPPGPFHAFLEAAAGTAPGFRAVTYLGRTRSYGELYAQVGRASGAMARDGVLPGSVVLVALPPCPAQLVTIVAALALGAVALVLDPDSTPEDELASLLARMDPALGVVHSHGPVERALHASRTHPRVVQISPATDAPAMLAPLVRIARPRSPVDGALEWKKWLAQARAPVTWPDVAPDDPALAFRSHDDEAMFVSHRQAAAGASMLRSWIADGIVGAERWLLAARLVEPFALTAALGAAMDLQAELVLLADRSERTVAEALAAYRPSFVVAEPSVRCPGQLALSVRAWISEADTECDQGCRGWQPDLAAGLVTCNPINGHRVPSSAGLPLPGAAVRAVDSQGFTVPADRIGQLEVRSLNLPWPDRWVPTGVSGSLDSAGHVFTLPGGPAAPDGRRPVNSQVTALSGGG